METIIVTKHGNLSKQGTSVHLLKQEQLDILLVMNSGKKEVEKNLIQATGKENTNAC